jgi:predicted nucleic acid-binding protein
LVTSYLDTSAAMKLLVEEAESAALTTYLQSEEVSEVVASWLLHTELHCAANRHPEDIDLAAVGVVLDTVTLIDLTRGDLRTAAALPGRLRSNDAVHLAVALRVGVDELITYDSELDVAVSASGLAVARPA